MKQVISALIGGKSRSFDRVKGDAALTRCTLIWIVVLAFSQGSYADEINGYVQLNQEPPRHRIDINGIYTDKAASESFSGQISYAYSLTDNSNIQLSLPYLDPDLDSGGNSGFGDLVAAFSYVPSVELGVNPWVPRTIGSGLALVIPAGNAREGRSLDAWVIAPFLGLVQPVSERFFIAPQIGYIHSLDETVAGTDIRLATADFGLSFVALNGFWASYFPQLLWDLEVGESALNHRAAVGKMLSSSLGFSVDYIYLERINIGSDLPAESGNDGQVEVNLHFVF